MKACFYFETPSLAVYLFGYHHVVGEIYQEIQYGLRLVICIVGCISLMAVLGRLNTNYLNIPQWMMFALYLYAAVQMLLVVNTSIAVDASVKVNKSAKPKANKKNSHKQRHIIGLSNFLYFYALIGKGCLCLVLCWVNQKNRFLFFLIHKANTLSDSEVMLQRFNQHYK